MDKVNILGVNVDMVTTEQAAEQILDFLSQDRLHMIFTPNSEILMKAYEDSDFSDVLNRADLLTADGIGVVYASKIVKKPIAERAAGFDITRRVLELMSKTDKSVYFFGAKPGVAEAAAKNVVEEFVGLKVAGVRNGYFKPEEVEEIIADINASGADLLLVGLGAPAQEKWIAQNADKLKVRAAAGIGGSFDVLAGVAERAPEFFCKVGLEWFYRLCKEPWRAKRMMSLPKFGWTVIKTRKQFINK